MKLRRRMIDCKSGDVGSGEALERHKQDWGRVDEGRDGVPVFPSKDDCDLPAIPNLHSGS